MADERAVTTVLKVGGAQLQGAAQLRRLSAYVARARGAGQAVVLVHGGGPEIGELHRQLALPFRKRRGLRVTPEGSMPLVTMVLCGLVNKRIVARLVSDGLPALGLCGVDRGALRAEFLNRKVLGRVGGPPRVDRARFAELLRAGQVIVLAPVCLGSDGEPVNVNADTVAHAVAAALAAARLEFVSDVAGIRTPQRGIADRLSAAEARQLLGSEAVTGGMIPKLQAALAALDTGIDRVRVGDLPGMMNDTATEITA